MNWKDKIEKWFSEHSLLILAAIFVVAVVSAAVVICYYPFHFSSFPIAEKDAAAPWGQLGDYLGGTLNPIFGFLSVMALLVALVIQSRELKISSEELKKSSDALDAQNRAIAQQSFEQTFFSWLSNYRDMLGAMSDLPTRNLVGGAALRQWWLDKFTEHNVIQKAKGLTADAQVDVFNEPLRGAVDIVARVQI